MISNKSTKINILIVLIILFVVSICVGLYYEYSSCMGIQIVSERQFSSYTENLTVNLDEITYNDEVVAADRNSGCIYISQSIDSLDHSSMLQGILKSNNPNHKLFFVEDDNIENIKDCVAEGNALTLIVTEGKSFCRLNIIITTLPIISVNGNEWGIDEKGRSVYDGKMTLFAGMNPGTERADIETSFVKWHVRGATSSKLEKKPWKLSLKDADGNNYNSDLLGMGEDDDWILNPMNLDDTKLREKTIMDLWNNSIKDSQNDYMMSDSEYVELVMNGEYQGLYLLQRRIDAKYLQIDKSKDIIFKGFPTWTPGSIQEGYEIVYTPFDIEKTYNILSEVLNDTTGNSIALENFIDVNLLLQFFSAKDNVGYKNMFYILQKTEEGYQMYFVPWDTDLSMGIIWESGFTYDFNMSMNDFSCRMEYNRIKELYPELDILMKSRWDDLNDTIYSAESIKQQIETNRQYICESGAFERDNQRWGFYYDGKDTVSELIRWCEERVVNMNNYYSR